MGAKKAKLIYSDYRIPAHGTYGTFWKLNIPLNYLVLVKYLLELELKITDEIKYISSCF